jgi:beta-1,4-mannosyltransferase
VSKQFVVLQSFPIPRPTTNPYLVLLGRSLRSLPDVEMLNFKWRTALVGSYDVMHVHWPEILVSGNDPLKKAVRQALFVILLARLQVTGTPLVRTMHNTALPTGISRREIFLLKTAQRQTTLRITLNTTTDLGTGQAFELIRHGDYRDWFADYDKTEAIPGRVVFFGLIRRYKGVDSLVRAFASTTAPEISLRIAGRPSSSELAGELRELAGDDPRVSMKLDFLTDAELVAEVGAASLVVLPYPEMHNSGGVLTALSLGRPVLVKDNEVNRLLAEEVGPGWVYTYPEQLTGQILIDTLQAVAQQTDRTGPDLSLRDWHQSGLAHLAAYRRAVAIRSYRRTAVAAAARRLAATVKLRSSRLLGKLGRG